MKISSMRASSFFGLKGFVRKSEAPRDATRTLVVRSVTPAIDKFVERHMHQARRIGTVGTATESRLPLSYVTTSLAGRPAALREVLDQTDPPSAVVLVLSDDSEAEAREAVRQLGYRRAEDVVRVSRDAVAPNTHTVIFTLTTAPPRRFFVARLAVTRGCSIAAKFPRCPLLRSQA